VAMTNYVSHTHNFQGQEEDLVPSQYLDVETTKDQRKALNPTPCDVQIGLVLGQIFGDQAKTKIAKRRIDFMSGNVNSYARILNGPAQLANIKTYNDLAASLVEYNNEVQEQKAVGLAAKKKADKDTKAKKAEREKLTEEQRILLEPVCAKHVAKGLTHCLGSRGIIKFQHNITVETRKHDILRFY
jgi:hypothetical protein